MSQLGFYSPETARDIYKKAMDDGFARDNANDDTDDYRQVWYLVKLKADLPAAAEALVQFTQAEAEVCAYKTNQATLEREVITTLTITITNRSTTKSYMFDSNEPTYIWVAFVHSEYVPVQASGSTGGDYFWFTVNRRICPDEVAYDYTYDPDYGEPLPGLIVTPTYTPTGYEPRQPTLYPRDDGFWLVQDVKNIMKGYDSDQVEGECGQAMWGHPLGEPDNGFWILVWINVLPDCN